MHEGGLTENEIFNLAGTTGDHLGSPKRSISPAYRDPFFYQHDCFIDDKSSPSKNKLSLGNQSSNTPFNTQQWRLESNNCSECPSPVKTPASLELRPMNLFQTVMEEASLKESDTEQRCGEQHTSKVGVQSTFEASSDTKEEDKLKTSFE